MKTVESSPKGWKTLWEKEKLLAPDQDAQVRAISPFPTVKKIVLQTSKNNGFSGLKGRFVYLVKEMHRFRSACTDRAH